MSQQTDDKANPNTAVWDQVSRTPEHFLKPFQGRGGFKGHAINSAYVDWTLTRLYGPCGVGWGIEILKDEIFEGHTLANGQNHLTHVILLKLWYQYDTETRGEIIQYGQTEYRYEVGRENARRVITDSEAWKKSVTDAKTKCASLLGIGADVFFGYWDDNRYVAMQRQTEQVSNVSAVQRPAPQLAPPSPPSSYGQPPENGPPIYDQETVFVHGEGTISDMVPGGAPEAAGEPKPLASVTPKVPPAPIQPPQEQQRTPEIAAPGELPEPTQEVSAKLIPKETLASYKPQSDEDWQMWGQHVASWLASMQSKDEVVHFQGALSGFLNECPVAAVKMWMKAAFSDRLQNLPG